MRLHNIREGWSRLPDIDREKYQERDGLEGPIMTRSGKVIYYDPKAGDYIDPDTDMYLSYSDFKALDDENMYKIDEFEFNPRAGHRDQMSHPENRGLGRNPSTPPNPKPRPKNLAPMTSPRPKARPANLQMRHDINKAVRSVVGEAGGYYTQPVYDMIKQHGYPKVMAELLAKLDADVIQDFLNRADLNEGPFKGVGKQLMKRKLNKQYKKSDLANFDDAGIDTSGKTPDEIRQMKSDYYHDNMDTAARAKKAGNRLGKNVKYGIVRYPDTAISYIKNDGSGWMHMYDKSYGFSGPVDKEDMKHAKKIDMNKIPSRMFENEVSDEEKEKAIQRAFSKSDEPERGEKRKKVTLKKAPWEESVSEGTKGCADCEWIKDETDGDIDTCDECAAEKRKTNEGTKGCADCEWIKDETDGDIDTCDECAAEKREKTNEAEERPYVCVHAKKGKHECHATSSYGAAKKAAEHWKMKSTAGIDAHLADVEKVAESEKRWKQTSMSAAEAEKEYGKANVKVKKGGLRNGDDMVQVFVENTREIDEGLSDVVKSVTNTFKRGFKSLTNTNNRPAKPPQPNQHTVKAGSKSGGTSIAQKINWGGKFGESADNSAMDKALRSIEKSFGPERKAIDDQVTAMCRTADMLGSDRFRDRAFGVVEQYGIHNKQELLQELQLMIRNEASVDDDEIHGPDSNIKRMKKAIEKIGSMQPTNEAQIMTEEQFDEAAGEKDACYRKVKSRYKVWPSAYASGALVKCRKVGAKNWGNSKK